MNPATIHVKMAEIHVAKDNAELTCLGLGSCIAVALYDPQNRIGGIAHVMLPFSHDAKNLTHPGKFADTAVKELLKRMRAKGADRAYIHARIFGGANMFGSAQASKRSVGEANIHAVLKELAYYEIPLLAKDVGGNTGRSIHFSIQHGHIMMRKMKEGILRNYLA